MLTPLIFWLPQNAHVVLYISPVWVWTCRCKCVCVYVFMWTAQPKQTAYPFVCFWAHAWWLLLLSLGNCSTSKRRLRGERERERVNMCVCMLEVHSVLRDLAARDFTVSKKIKEIRKDDKMRGKAGQNASMCRCQKVKKAAMIKTGSAIEC